MDRIDDWPRPWPPRSLAVSRAASTVGADAGALTPQVIGDALVGLQPPAVQVNCYVDVGYPWIQVAFDTIIGPDVAVRVAQALVARGGDDKVLFNSLRPMAVFFLLAAPVDDEAPELSADRYGVRLSKLLPAWTQPGSAPAAPARSRGGARRASQRPAAAG